MLKSFENIELICIDINGKSYTSVINMSDMTINKAPAVYPRSGFKLDK